MRKHGWRIDADVSAISGLVDRIMVLVREGGCAAGKEHDVDLALREALSNAVVHGGRGNPAARVSVTLSCDTAEGLTIVVRDAGGGFDPSLLASPLAGDGIRAAHGRGIFLIQQLMDEVRFERGGTEIHMSVVARENGEPD